MSKSAAMRVQAHRHALRMAGLRLIQIWVPDIHRKGFAAECHRQSQLISHDPQEGEMLHWIESISDNEGWV
jgi:hypothetical protein